MKKLVVEYTLEIKDEDYEKVFGQNPPKEFSAAQAKNWRIIRMGAEPIYAGTLKMLNGLGLTEYVVGPFSIVMSVVQERQ